MSDDRPCARRAYGTDNIVCVCNMTYCDTITRIPPLSTKEYVIYSTTRAGLRFNKTKGVFEDKPKIDGKNSYYCIESSLLRFYEIYLNLE